MDRAPNLKNFNTSETRNTSDKQGYDYKEIAREVLARIDQRLADLERDPPQASEAPPSEPRSAGEAETVIDVMSRDDQSALVRLALRGLVGLVLSAGLIAAIAFLWSRHDAAQEVATPASPRAALSASLPEDKPQPAPEQGQPVAPAAAADAASVQSAPAQAAQAVAVQAVPAQAPLPRTAPDTDKPNAAPVNPELAALMRKVDRDIAGLAQAVNELRAAQQQASGDNAKVADEIKTSVDQMARIIARAASETRAAAEPAAPAKPAASTAPSRTVTPAPQKRKSVPMSYSPRDAEAQLLR